MALKDDEITVVGHGRTLKEALEDARRNGYENPIMTRMPDELVSYIGYGL